MISGRNILVHKVYKVVKSIKSNGPCGRFVYSSKAAGKHCPKDSCDLIDFMNFIDLMD